MCPHRNGIALADGGRECLFMSTQFCRCHGHFLTSEVKAVSAEQLGQKGSCGLKICFWETGVPVRVRPRPPKSTDTAITYDEVFVTSPERLRTMPTPSW